MTQHNHKHTRIALVLDRSGSMESIREQARDAFNEALQRIKSDAAAGGHTTLTVVAFNQALQDLALNAPVAQVKPLGPGDYQPDGMTALFDGAGRAIDVLQGAGALGADDAALVIVISDGHENSSQKVTQKDLVERMQALEATGQWTFSFLCANVDIRNLSRQLGTESSNYAAWQATPMGAVAMKEQLGGSVQAYMADRRTGLRQKKAFFDADAKGRDKK